MDSHAQSTDAIVISDQKNDMQFEEKRHRPNPQAISGHNRPEKESFTHVKGYQARARNSEGVNPVCF